MNSVLNYFKEVFKKIKLITFAYTLHMILPISLVSRKLNLTFIL